MSLTAIIEVSNNFLHSGSTLVIASTGRSMTLNGKDYGKPRAATP